MKRYLQELIAVSLALTIMVGAGCDLLARKSPPPPGAVPSDPHLNDALGSKESKASAAVAGAQTALASTPPSPGRTAAQGELGVAEANLGKPKPEDLEEALQRVQKALSGKTEDLMAAQAAWAKAREDGYALQQRVLQLQQQVLTERADAAAELKRRLDEKDEEIRSAAAKAKREADARLNFWLQLGCFGGGVAFGVLGLAAAQFAPMAPFLGPNIVRLLWAVGGGLVVLGVLIRSVDRFVDQHPHLFFGLLCGVVIALIAAAATAWTNHHHAKTTPTPAG